MTISKLVPVKLKELYRAYKNTRAITERLCPICNYSGYFLSNGKPLRVDAKCPHCGSLERHRLFWLWYKEQNDTLSEPIIHFAAEKTLERQLKNINTNYRTADLFRKADLKLDIENIDLEDSSIGTLMCNHVLEHVDDKLALEEMYRVLKPGGKLICSVPIVEGWDATYENNNIIEAQSRELHFGQHDHLRFYGRDFRERLSEAGFLLQEYTASGAAAVEYGLIRGQKIFICEKKA